MSSSLIVSGLPTRIIEIVFKIHSGAVWGSEALYFVPCPKSEVNMNTISTVFLPKIPSF